MDTLHAGTSRHPGRPSGTGCRSLKAAVIKVLYVIPTLDRSGAERQLALLATGLPRNQFQPHVVALTRGGPYEQLLQENQVPVTRLGKRWRFDLLAAMRLRRVIRQEQPDVIHSFLFAGNAYARLIPPSQHRPAMVCSERCVDSWKRPWQLWLDRQLIRRTDALLANSQAVADFYASRGIPSDLISVIPNGVVDPGVATQEERHAVRTELGLPPDAHLVAHSGRLARQKRVHDLVWAFQLLRQTVDNVYFVICGDGPERPRVQQRIRHFEIERLVRLAGHRNDASSIVRAADVFWLGSDFEGMSNSLTEAMAAGVPAVATRIAANQSLIEHGQTGYLVAPGDAQGFQQFAQDLLLQPELRNRLGQAARQSVLDRFPVETMIQAHADLYTRLCGRG